MCLAINNYSVRRRTGWLWGSAKSCAEFRHRIFLHRRWNWRCCNTCTPEQRIYYEYNEI